MLNISRAGRGTGPIRNRRITAAVTSIGGMELLSNADGNRDLNLEFTGFFTDWIRSCRSTPVQGLDQFTTRYVVNGVTQSYDIFLYEHKGRRLRTAIGDYPYVRLSVDDWAHLEDDEIRENDAVTLSCPFYADGGVPQNYTKILDRCAELGVPVFVDAAYFGTCTGTAYDFSHPAIEMLSFSLSKPFCIQSYRAGMLMMKRTLPYLEEIQTAARYFNRVGAYVGLKLMRQFSADFIPETYGVAYKNVCRELDVLSTHCLMIGGVKHQDSRFDSILRDDRFEEVALPEGQHRRVCVSNYLSDRDSLGRRVARAAVRRVRTLLPT
jgi:hypothetical protein